MYSPNGYSQGPLYDSAAKQIAFLFTRLSEFIEQAEQHRQAKRYQDFSHAYERAYALASGLFSWLILQEKETESMAITSTTRPSWQAYFDTVLVALNRLSLEENPTLYTILINNLKQASFFWIDSEYAFLQQPDFFTKTFLDAQEQGL